MLFWERPDVIKQWLPDVDLDEVNRIRVESNKQLLIEKFKVMAEGLAAMPRLEDLNSLPEIILNRDHVTIGSRKDVSESQFETIVEAVKRLHPWRKGPFNLFGLEIDTEWRSNLKWDRIESALGELQGRKILDVGCGNGYYMFRAAAHDPAMVLGIDPSLPFCMVFEMMQRYLQMPSLQYERMGCEHLPVFDAVFDVAMCMGIVYHHRSPVDILKNLLSSLRVGGVAIIESQTIPGSGDIALFPADRYAKARNVYFVPTKDCFVNWVRRAGFRNVEVVDHTKVTFEEQRRTSFMTFESLADFLDPDNDEKTLEGYPAPWRTVIRAERKF